MNSMQYDKLVVGPSESINWIFGSFLERPTVSEIKKNKFNNNHKSKA